MSNFDINVDRRTDGQTDGKAGAYVALCYKQVRQKSTDDILKRFSNLFQKTGFDIS